MKRIYTLLILFIGLMQFGLNAQDRFLDEVFDDVTVTNNVIYGFNTTVLPALQGADPVGRQLYLNLIEPTGDTFEQRPVILMFHTGNFLPRLLNGNNNGTVEDPYIVSLSERLAKMGYVVAIVDYRKGWNPISPSQQVRTETLINAAYRGVQDANTCARFFRSSVDDGNPYGIDPDRITVWGVGTGGYIAFGAATLDTYADVVLPKFIGSDINGDGVPDPMVIQPIHGDPFATTVGQNPTNGDTLCYANHVGYSSDFQLCVNMGGALGDTSWVDANDPPMISFHVPTDPFAPYEEDILIVPTTGELVVEVQGSYLAQQKANEFGLNASFEGQSFGDVFTMSADETNDNLEGLFPMRRPAWDLTDDSVDNPEFVEASPWEYWDETTWSTAPLGQATLSDAGGPCEGIPMEFCNWHIIQQGSNPDMSFAKATAYQDSILGYFAPRAFLALDLDNLSSSEEILDANLVEIYPNPASNFLFVKSSEMAIKSVEVMDMQGRLIKADRNVNNYTHTINKQEVGSGMFIVNVRFENGIVTEKVVFE